MKSPFTGGDAALCHEKQSFEFRKDNFEIVYHFYRCKDTNEEFTTTELDQLNMNQVYNLYRQKYAIPFPDEITKPKTRRSCPSYSRYGMRSSTAFNTSNMKSVYS